MSSYDWVRAFKWCSRRASSPWLLADCRSWGPPVRILNACTWASLKKGNTTKLSMPWEVRSGRFVMSFFKIISHPSNGSCDIRWYDTWQMATKEMKYLYRLCFCLKQTCFLCIILLKSFGFWCVIFGSAMNCPIAFGALIETLPFDVEKASGSKASKEASKPWKKHHSAWYDRT